MRCETEAIVGALTAPIFDGPGDLPHWGAVGAHSTSLLAPMHRWGFRSINHRAGATLNAVGGTSAGQQFFVLSPEVVPVSTTSTAGAPRVAPSPSRGPSSALPSRRYAISVFLLMTRPPSRRRKIPPSLHHYAVPPRWQGVFYFIFFRDWCCSFPQHRISRPSTIRRNLRRAPAALAVWRCRPGTSSRRQESVRIQPTLRGAHPGPRPRP